MKQYLHMIAELIHRLQKERGLTTSYLKSHATLFQEPTQNHFPYTDKALAKCLRQTSSPALPKEFANATSQLQNIREQILNSQIAVPQALDYYSYKLINPLLQYSITLALGAPNEADAPAYNAFMQWKENLGLERAIGTSALIAEPQNSYDSFIEQISMLLSNAENNRKFCFLLATPAQKELLQNIQNHKTLADEIHYKFKQGDENIATEIKNLTAETWFALLDEKMELLHHYEKKFIDNLYNEAPQKNPELNENTDNQASSATPTHKTTNTNPQKANAPFGKYRNLLRALALFEGLSDANLDAILRRAAVRSYAKHEKIVNEGEQLSQFHLLLSGWVKIFGISENGEEAVLQMLGAGDTIMEQCVLLNMSPLAHAQAVKEAELLSLPAELLRSYVSEDKRLALNFLRVMASRSRSFIWHVENLRTRNAEHRLGWFLLRLLVEKKHASRYISLPYDKSLIASYLDMKPETLSRSLHKLKAQGFEIRSDTVVVPSFTALCRFCDRATAEQCGRRENTPDCPFNE